MAETLCVTTKDPPEDIVAANNSAAWFLNASRASAAEYLVCVALVPDRPDVNRKPFLVAEISDVVHDPGASKERRRYAILFRRYALLNPELQRALTGSQNPVRWGKLQDFIGQEAAALNWREAPPPTLDYSYSRREPRDLARWGLTVEEAKKGLAVKFGVPEEAITINIRI